MIVKASGVMEGDMITINLTDTEFVFSDLVFVDTVAWNYDHVEVIGWCTFDNDRKRFALPYDFDVDVIVGKGVKA